MTDLMRARSLKIGKTELGLPIFFPSVSSVKTTMAPLEYVRVINALRATNGQFLVSAFDLGRTNNEERAALQSELTQAREAGTVVLMDSGNYESYWKDARSDWTHADFHKALSDFHCDFAFGFDEQEPPSDNAQHVRLILERHAQDQAAAGHTTIVPIIHGVPSELPALCAEVAQATRVEMLAVPERRLGSGIFERTRAIADIRRALNKTGRYIHLHLLGTGNPISLSLYSINGADSFDGLEWCQTVVDHESALLFHFSQADFFRAQTSWGEQDLTFQTRVLAHNLEFYTNWMGRLRESIHDGRGIDFCRLNFPHRIYLQCAAALGWTDNT